MKNKKIFYMHVISDFTASVHGRFTYYNAFQTTTKPGVIFKTGYKCTSRCVANKSFFDNLKMMTIKMESLFCELIISSTNTCKNYLVRFQTRFSNRIVQL